MIKYVISKNILYEGIKKVESNPIHYVLDNEQFKLIILVGNARESVPLLRQIDQAEFNCIYQDAFSPKRNSILWTKEWFDLLYSYAHQDCIMSTYSSSSSIRKSMIAAKWSLYKGDQFGPKRSSTRAKITGETEITILEHLARSPAITITDDNYKNYKL